MPSAGEGYGDPELIATQNRSITSELVTEHRRQRVPDAPTFDRSPLDTTGRRQPRL